MTYSFSLSSFYLCAPLPSLPFPPPHFFSSSSSPSSHARYMFLPSCHRWHYLPCHRHVPPCYQVFYLCLGALNLVPHASVAITSPAQPSLKFQVPVVSWFSFLSECCFLFLLSLCNFFFLNVLVCQIHKFSNLSSISGLAFWL